MTAQIIDIAGQKMALLPVAEYERLLEVAEDGADALAARNAERRRDEGEEYLPSDLVDRILAGESALKVWRTYRGMTLASLAESAGMTHASLSRTENGKQQPKTAQWRALANALNVTVDDILPVD